MSKYSHGLRRYSAPWIFCSQCGHRDRDYRMPLGMCEDVVACERRIMQARSVLLVPPVDACNMNNNVEEHACAAPETTGYIEYARFVSDGVRYEFVAVK